MFYHTTFSKIYTPIKLLYNRNNLVKLILLKNNITKKPYVVKCGINKTNMKNDYNIAKKFHSKNIMNYTGLYTNHKKSYIIMPYYKKGNLLQNLYCMRNGITNYKSFFLEVLYPIQILHKNNIAHLDIKFENYIISNDNNLLLTDFETSRKINERLNYMDWNRIFGV